MLNLHLRSKVGDSRFMSSIPLKISLYLQIIERIKNSPPWLKTIVKGFWLGILSRGELQTIDRIYYEQTSYYCDESYNKSGFFEWERKAFMKFFQSCQTVVVAAIGGGRETIALNRLGFDVDGFECNRQLFEFAEKLFAQETVEGEFHLVPPDAVWHFGKIYDGAIIGWGGYMLIQGRANRIDFLKKMRSQMLDGAPLLVSFYARWSDGIYFKRIYATANFFRALLSREKLEFGDDLYPLSFAHWFSEAKINAELAEAGFTVIYYSWIPPPPPRVAQEPELLQNVEQH